MLQLAQLEGEERGGSHKTDNSKKQGTHKGEEGFRREYVTAKEGVRGAKRGRVERQKKFWVKFFFFATKKQCNDNLWDTGHLLKNSFYLWPER